MICPDEFCDLHRGRGCCGACWTPFMCGDLWCGCHDPRAGARCRADSCGQALLYVAPPARLTYDVVFGTRWAA